MPGDKWPVVALAPGPFMDLKSNGAVLGFFRILSSDLTALTPAVAQPQPYEVGLLLMLRSFGIDAFFGIKLESWTFRFSKKKKFQATHSDRCEIKSPFPITNQDGTV